MRRATKIALLSIGGSVLVLVSSAGAFLFGHSVGMGERAATNRALLAREQATLEAGNITRTAFQGWSLVCRDWEEVERRCVLFMAVADPGMQQVLLTLSVARTPNGMPLLIVDTPAGVAVDEGVTVTPGATEGIRLAIQSCGPQRCRAVAELSPSLQSALEASEATAVRYVKADNQPSSYNLPTRGFSEGIAAWYAETGLPATSAAAVN